MNHLIISLLADGAVATLLVLAIFYCGKLNTRIRILQDSKSELAQLIKQFDESTTNATLSIQEIHRASKQLNDHMKERLQKANYIADDLAFMIEKGAKLADRMEDGINVSRSATSSNATTRSSTNSRVNNIEVNELVETAQVSPISSTRRRPVVEPEVRAAVSGSEPRKTAALEAMLEKISADKKTSGGRMQPGVRLRSRAEQDLYDAMQADKK